MNFAPVADVAKDKNSFIYDRTLGQDYATTAKYIPVAVRSIQSQKVASCLKHFPGYGDTADTHTGFAQISKPLSKYEKEDLLPFKAGIKAGADGIMISHIVIKDIDNRLFGHRRVFYCQKLKLPKIIYIFTMDIMDFLFFEKKNK